MPTYEYRNLRLNIPEQDTEYSGYFEAARDHKLVCKKCTSCGLMRGEPSHGCPFCPSYDWEWQEVSGKGTIYSYQIVAHTVMTGFKDFAPFAIVLVELDEQRGQPTPDDGLRITANLVDDSFGPEKEENCAIGKRVQIVYQDESEGLTIPQWKLSDEPPEGEPWRL